MHTEWEMFCLSFIFIVVGLGFNMYVNSDNMLFSLFLISSQKCPPAKCNAVIAQRAATVLQKLLFPLDYAGGVLYCILLHRLVGWCTSGAWCCLSIPSSGSFKSLLVWHGWMLFNKSAQDSLLKLTL